MELAVSPTTPGLGVRELTDLCTWAEERGYRSAWLAEVAGPDAFVLATAIAMATTEMTVGVAVVPAFTRTPAVLATAAGSVSQVLAGRTFRLGIGSSSEVIVSSWHGLRFDRPLTRVRETVQAVRAGLSSSGEYQGQTVSMSRFRPASRPAGPVEVYVAALGPAMLAIAGEVADGVCLNISPPEAVVRQLAEVEKGAARAGRGLGNTFGVMARLHVAIVDDPKPVRAALRDSLLGPYLAQPVYNRFLSWAGYEEEAAAIARGWAAKDRQAVAEAIHDRLVDQLVIVGNENHVRTRLDEFAGAGITAAALSVPDPSLVGDTLGRLAP
jgi:probable F420-dependent oxidoreductase